MNSYEIMLQNASYIGNGLCLGFGAIAIGASLGYLMNKFGAMNVLFSFWIIVIILFIFFL